MSINVGPLDGGRHKCELNNDTAENHASSFLQTKMDYTFFGIEVRCLITRVNKKVTPSTHPSLHGSVIAQKCRMRRKGINRKDNIK